MTVRIDYASLSTLAFAGGGNRCWWQAGLMARLREETLALPTKVVATSAGAAIAASCLLDGPEVALHACLRLFAANDRMFDWAALAKGRLQFAHREIYPAWIAALVDATNFERLRTAKSALSVAITRPAKTLGLAGSIVVGTLAYLLDKKVWHRIHPRIPHLLGLRQEFIAAGRCRSVDEMRAVLTAAAAAPPIMSSVQIDGAWAFDGGYTDNAPVPSQSKLERAATLVLLTRHYPAQAAIFRWGGRFYWQPRQPVPVSTWDCTKNATVTRAFECGYEDATRALKSGALVFGERPTMR